MRISDGDDLYLLVLGDVAPHRLLHQGSAQDRYVAYPLKPLVLFMCTCDHYSAMYSYVCAAHAMIFMCSIPISFYIATSQWVYVHIFVSVAVLQVMEENHVAHELRCAIQTQSLPLLRQAIALAERHKMHMYLPEYQVLPRSCSHSHSHTVWCFGHKGLEDDMLHA